MRKSQKLINDNAEEWGVSLAPLTSWHIGGLAERYFCPVNGESLAEYLRTLPIDVPCTWLGLGSNVLVRDGGVQGTVIATRKLQTLFQEKDGTIFAEAGLTCAKLAKFCIAKGFNEAAFFAGIPGTVGGALAMNAGAFGGETWEWVQAVKVVDRKGHVKFRDASDYTIGYRSVVGRYCEQTQEAFLGAVLKFPSTINDGDNKIKTLLRKRAGSQPIGTFNCGSVYRNPPGDFAARLIEACDLKGYQVGHAMVSPKHANFIINCGQARSEEVETLMNIIESQVLDRFGIALHTEVRILGQREKL